MIPREGAFFTPDSIKHKSGGIRSGIILYRLLAGLAVAWNLAAFPLRAMAILPENGLKLADLTIQPTPTEASGAIPTEAADAPKTYQVWVTAYTSSPEETDDTPFETASGGRTRDGVIAANFLPFGTKVKIPSEFGDKIFTVEDRMHRRKKNFVDVWMPTKKEALRFGIRYTAIVIVEENTKSQLALKDE